MQVKIKKLHPNAKLPKYAKNGDAGLDITCTDVRYTEQYIEYDTGLAFEIPEGYVGLLFARSSISTKDLSLSNAVGVLDSSYRGHVTFRFKRLGDTFVRKIYEVGDRVGQIMIIPYPQIEFVIADELSETERGSGGYGSSGN